MKYGPIMTKHNNRYRGPFESYKDVAFESDLIYNIKFLKEKYTQFENELKHINNIVKSNNGMYNEIRRDLTAIKHNIDNNIDALNKM